MFHFTHSVLEETSKVRNNCNRTVRCNSTEKAKGGNEIIEVPVQAGGTKRCPILRNMSEKTSKHKKEGVGGTFQV